MDKMTAICFYINGLRKNQSHDVPPELIQFIHCCLTNRKTHTEEVLIQRLRLFSDYWQEMTWEMALNDIDRFSQLMVNNAGPLEFYDDLLALLTAHLSMQHKQQGLWWAHKIVIACCGRTHLYIDMGFEQRHSITALFTRYFPQNPKPDNPVIQDA